MKERKALNKRYLSHLITQSKTHDLDKLLRSKNINCYAAARLLTYPDRNKSYYAPGRIYNLEHGNGNFVRDNLDPNFIDECIMRDSKTLYQPCTRVNFDKIRKDDIHHYFGICKFHICPSRISDPLMHRYLKDVDDSIMEEQWHFIFRLSNGTWLHKPSFEEPIESIQWDIYGKTFTSYSYNHIFGILVPKEYRCFQEFFYRIDEISPVL